MRFYGSVNWMPRACPVEAPVSSYTKRSHAGLRPRRNARPQVSGDLGDLRSAGVARRETGHSPNRESPAWAPVRSDGRRPVGPIITTGATCHRRLGHDPDGDADRQTAASDERAETDVRGHGDVPSGLLLFPHTFRSEDGTRLPRDSPLIRCLIGYNVAFRTSVPVG